MFFCRDAFIPTDIPTNMLGILHAARQRGNYPGIQYVMPVSKSANLLSSWQASPA